MKNIKKIAISIIVLLIIACIAITFWKLDTIKKQLNISDNNVKKTEQKKETTIAKKDEKVTKKKVEKDLNIIKSRAGKLYSKITGRSDKDLIFTDVRKVYDFNSKRNTYELENPDFKIKLDKSLENLVSYHSDNGLAEDEKMLKDDAQKRALKLLKDLGLEKEYKLKKIETYKNNLWSVWFSSESKNSTEGMEVHLGKNFDIVDIDVIKEDK